MSGDEAHGAAERIARESYGRLVALLAARTRDVTAAEDMLAEAFAAALDQWERGIPFDVPEPADLSRISAGKRFAAYQPYWATLGYLHLRAGHEEAGREALTVAIGLSTDDAVRRYLRQSLPA